MKKSSINFASLGRICASTRKFCNASALPSTSSAVLQVMVTYLSGSERNWKVWPSVKALAGDTGFSEKTVRNATKYLAERGLILKSKIGKMGCNNNVYELIFVEKLDLKMVKVHPSGTEPDTVTEQATGTHKVYYPTGNTKTEGKLTEGNSSPADCESPSIGEKPFPKDSKENQGHCKYLQLKETTVKLSEIGSEPKVNPHKQGSPSYFGHVWVQGCKKHYPSMFLGSFMKPKNLKMVKQLADDMQDSDGSVIEAIISRWDDCVTFIQQNGEYFNPKQPSLPGLLKRADTARQWYNTACKPASCVLSDDTVSSYTNVPVGEKKAQKAAKHAELSALLKSTK